MPKLTAWQATCPNLATERCPCVLADLRACPNCSHLAGYPLCACEWRGFCPFLERQWSSQPMTRVGSPPTVVASSQSAPGVLELAVTVGDRSLDPYQLPGAVVRLGMDQGQRDHLRPTAIVADVDPERQALLLSVSLAQPENLLFGEADAVWLDPHPGNMLLGGNRLADLADGHALVVASGIGQAALTLIAKTLRRQGVALTVVVAPGKAGANFVIGRAQSLGVIVHSLHELSGRGRELTEKLLRQEPFDLVVSLGGDEQHRWLGQLLADSGSMLPVVACDTYRYPFLTE